MKNRFLVFLLLIPLMLFSRTHNNSEYQTISGFISHKNDRLSNVSIFIEGTMRFTVTDSIGYYNIKAKVGETISFSYVGLKKVWVLIEDVTTVLNINLELENTITGLKPKKVLKLGGSDIGNDAAPYNIRKIEGNSLDKFAPSLTKAIENKVPELLVKINQFGEEIAYLKGRELEGPALWVFDGVTFGLPIPVYISEVEEVLVINSEEKGFIILVKTNIDYKKVKGINYDDYYLTDADYYRNDAIQYKKIKTKKPKYLEEYPKRVNSKKALEIYLNQYPKYKNEVNYHFNVFNYFKKEKFSENNMLKVLTDFEDFSPNNPEDLKGIAYKYQELKEQEKALAVYKKIVKLRPEYRQSYRDLANTYISLKQYRDAWLAYHYYLNKNFKIEDNDIGEIMGSEIIATYNLDKEDKNSTQKIKIENSKKNIESDVRLVFEWNTSEAEFILEFVNPDLLPYAVENSSSDNIDLIIDQKKKGYTSKEVFIENLKQGDWLVNLTYLGNKQSKPTIFKITTYYNWGRPNQTEKIEVFDFTQLNLKTALLKLNGKWL
ncbi:carboxypeptidase-like regulatory domain-containing protein [Polaribacter litorisediminis]|uniref:carboxypeptidase-like regulatory domain-containing protein n=1 Tax=Polaribacter litorisediminis TaxID=1908341 RepID=UPI001CC164CC|nr:carboxypeptidase-like regulatory domain-containing protein [Polaribacter litorisediminis]UAM99785.1 carboxypeptidase-like regulatory domain-containing protein [Polaribacter litorisediminis]